MSFRLPSAEDIVLGTTCSPLPYPQFRLSPQDQGYHACLFGMTGSGKSKLLQSIFLQHLNKKHGVAMMEPHHDLSLQTLTYLISRGFFKNDDAYERLIYIDWGARDAFVPFNILDPNNPKTSALNALESFVRVFDELAKAPAFQVLFLSSATTLAINKLPITFIYPLLTQVEFRKKCLANVVDPLIHQSFEHFDRLGREQAELAGSTLRRAFLVSFSDYTRLTFGSSDCWLNFREIMDSGRSIIINLGNINDHETQRLIGAMLLVKLEEAALSRTDLAPSQRVPFTALIDEWPAFCAQEQTIATILSQTRKFNLRLWLAAQSPAQIGSRRLTGALENCRLQICFGVGRDSAELEAKYLGKADPFLIKEEALR